MRSYGRYYSLKLASVFVKDKEGETDCFFFTSETSLIIVTLSQPLLWAKYLHVDLIPHDNFSLSSEYIILTLIFAVVLLIFQS